MVGWVGVVVRTRKAPAGGGMNNARAQFLRPVGTFGSCGGWNEQRAGAVLAAPVYSGSGSGGGGAGSALQRVRERLSREEDEAPLVCPRDEEYWSCESD